MEYKYTSQSVGKPRRGSVYLHTHAIDPKYMQPHPLLVPSPRCRCVRNDGNLRPVTVSIQSTSQEPSLLGPLLNHPSLAPP